MQLSDYIRGKKHGKEANSLEREAMNDPFLQDAIDGFDAVQGDHARSVEELEKLLLQKLNKRKPFISVRIWTTGIAAAIVLLLGIGGLMYLDRKAPVAVAVRVAKKLNKSAVVVPVKPIAQPVQRTVAFNTQKQLQRKVDIPEQPTQLAEMNVVEEKASAGAVSTVTVESLTSAPIRAEQIAFKPVTSGALDSAQQLAFHNALAGKVSGLVVDERGEPIPGATIKIRGISSPGTITGADGKFTLPKVDRKNDKLVANYIGYVSQEVPVSGDTALIRLKPNNLALNEVVVVGYGAKKQIKLPPVTLDQSLQGRVAGLDASTGAYVFGESKFRKYVEKHRSDSICGGNGGSVVIRFTIDKTGTPTDINVEKSDCEQLTKEITRLLRESPRWTAKGRSVKMRFVLK